MGLFGKEECCLCKEKVSSLNRIKIKDGVICGECALKCSQGFPFASSSLDDLNNHLAYRVENERKFTEFTPTFSCKPYIFIDYEKKEWYTQSNHKKRTPDIFSFSDLVNFEYIEDGNTVIESKGGIGRAVVGGALLGSTGAIVGANTAKSIEKLTVTTAYIRISLKNQFASERKIDLLVSETKKSSVYYKSIKSLADTILSNLERMRAESDSLSVAHENSAPVASVADEIIKFKQLLDSGIITQEEFNVKKNQLLGL